MQRISFPLLLKYQKLKTNAVNQKFKKPLINFNRVDCINHNWPKLLFDE